MEINNIKLAEGMPTDVTVTMNLKEFSLLFSMIGKCSPAKIEEVYGPDYTEALETIYGGGSFLYTSFWDNGIDEYIRHNHRIDVELSRK